MRASLLLLALLAPGCGPRKGATGSSGLRAPAGGGPAELPDDAYTITASGLAWATLRPGQGPVPREGETLVLHYTGWLADGTRFDTSRDEQGPLLHRVGAADLVPGLLEGLGSIQEGEVRQLVIPSALAFGATGRPPAIPPHATVIYEVELLEIDRDRMPHEGPVEAPAYQETPSGLRYAVLQEGAGAAPARGDVAVVEYTGWLADGTLFDSTYHRAEPIRVPVGTRRVIPGWEEALQGMPEGATWQLHVPADLAYGARGRPPLIPPDADLVFILELVEVQRAP